VSRVLRLYLIDLLDNSNRAITVRHGVECAQARFLNHQFPEIVEVRERFTDGISRAIGFPSGRQFGAAV
jgi:hypothetical protein